MPLEIERRFLACPDALRHSAGGRRIVQGYLRADGRLTVRVRIDGGAGVLTVKGQRNGFARLEFEEPLSLAAAHNLLSRVPAEHRITKIRHHVAFDGHLWEVDEFDGLNAGLIIAEIELDRPDRAFALPPWAGPEITHDRRYGNSGLARNPYSRWTLAA